MNIDSLHPDLCAIPDGRGYRIALDNGAAAIDDEGWCLIAPYGTHEKVRLVKKDGRLIEQRFSQVLDNASADALLSSENSLFRKLRRAIVGIPVYNGKAGHPDTRDYAPETLANSQRKEVIGVIDRVRKAARGIEAHFSLTERGAELIENDGCKYPSALWWVMPFDDANGVISARPYKLISASLTAHPNISGVDSLANARPNTPAAISNADKETVMKSLIIGWLAAQGIALANDASEQSVFDAFQTWVKSQGTNITALGNDKSTLSIQLTALTAEKTTLSGKVTALENDKTTLSTKVTALENDVKAARTARIEAVVDLAIAKGKLAVSERAGKITTLVALDNTKLEEDIKKLLASATKHKVLGGDTNVRSGKVLANDGTDPDNTPDAREEYKQAIAEHMTKNPGCDPIKAHSAVMKAKPELAEKLAARGAK